MGLKWDSKDWKMVGRGGGLERIYVLLPGLMIKHFFTSENELGTRDLGSQTHSLTE